jgi:CheY-like chemotaxis protein
MRGKLAVISPFKVIGCSDPHILQAIISPKSAWNTPFERHCSIVQCPLAELTVFCFFETAKNALIVANWPQVERMCLCAPELKFTMLISLWRTVSLLMDKKRILLADDHPHFSELVESLLGSTFEVVGKVNDGQALLDAAVALKPDVILTDISMPVLNGIEAVDELHRSGCNSKIIFVTIHSDLDFVRSCMAVGAAGYIVKPRIALDLLHAIREVLAGNMFISPNLSEGNQSS